MISKLIPGTGNLGGFRAAGTREDKKVVVLYTSGEDRDWPNRLDPNEGKFVYFGDNKGTWMSAPRKTWKSYFATHF